MNPDLLVFGAGLLAGTMNALAGGGSFVSIGGYCGALVGRRAAPQVIRVGTLFIAGCITPLFFARAYLKEVPW